MGINKTIVHEAKSVDNESEVRYIMDTETGIVI